MTQFLAFAFGSSWKSSLISLLGGIVLAVTTYAEGRSEPGWYVVALLLPILGRAVKDADKTGGTSPATPEAQARLAK